MFAAIAAAVVSSALVVVVVGGGGDRGSGHLVLATLLLITEYCFRALLI